MTEFKACKDCRFYAEVWQGKAIQVERACLNPFIAYPDVVSGEILQARKCVEARDHGACKREAVFFEPVERAPPQRAIPRGNVYETLDESAECNCVTCFFINREAEDEPCASCAQFDQWTACPPPRKGDSE